MRILWAGFKEKNENVKNPDIELAFRLFPKLLARIENYWQEGNYVAAYNIFKAEQFKKTLKLVNKFK